MTSARPESPEGSARGQFEERNLSWSGMVTRPGVLTRSMTRTLAHPPTFAALPNSPNRRVVLQTFVPDNAVPSGHTASTYVTERTSSLPPEEMARQFQEMQEKLNRLFMDNEQMKGLLASAGIQYPAEEEEQAPPPSPANRNVPFHYGPEPSSSHPPVQTVPTSAPPAMAPPPDGG